MRHRLTARSPLPSSPLHIDDDAAVVSTFLSDAAHVPGGFAAGVCFPRSESEVAAAVAQASRVLPVGAQSSLTGGATPRGDLVLSTRSLRRIGSVGNGVVTVDAGVPLAELQQALAAEGCYYPPVPTFDGAFVGGTVSTNAAGPTTFKYGSTRPWVVGLTAVLADGSVLDLRRGDTWASADGTFEILRPSGDISIVRVPRYAMPQVAKLSAGYFARPDMDIIDLFIGSEGTLAVIVTVTLRVIALPRRCAALVLCSGDDQAVALTSALRDEANRAWHGRGPLDVAAIEYMDSRALLAVSDDAFGRAGVSRPPSGTVMLLVQIEVPADDDAALAQFAEVLANCGIAGDPHLAAPGDTRGLQRLFDLREAVPAGVNAIIAAAKQASPDIEKTAGDMVVPFRHLRESLAVYRREFEARGLDYAIWGHVSDGNLHANVVPRSFDDVQEGRLAIRQIASAVIAMGGAPLAEHGVGRSPLKQQLLRDLYGEDGVEQMRAVKRALDPEWKLSPGVLFE